MRREQLDRFRDWFVNYVKNFTGGDNNTRLGVRVKEEHTWRVCENAVQIGKSLGLEEKDLLLAETIALFHDLGRFRQIQIYGTFDDRKSDNHARMGARELERTGVLSGLEEAEQELVTRAVECHNLWHLPDLSERCLFFTRLIRDADKLDILEVFCRYHSRENPELASVLDAGLPDTPGYNRQLAEDLLQQRSCRYSDMQNLNDRRLLQLSWLYDINFPYTLAEIARRGYVEEIMAGLPRTGEIREVYHHLQSYLARGGGEKKESL